MTTTASPEQLHGLLMYCIDFARTMLSDAGDFYPFGATLAPSGQPAAIGGHTGEERPEPQQLYKLLADALASEARDGHVAGIALAANVTIPPQYSAKFRDALRVHLESQGFARFIYVPYQLKKAGLLGRTIAVEFDEPISVGIAATIFVAPGNP